MNTELSVEGLIQKAYDKLKASDPASALGVLEEALKLDFENSQVKYSLKCLNWWLEHTKDLEKFDDPYDKGGLILSQWKHYYSFLDRLTEEKPDGFEACQYAIKGFVYARALGFFNKVLGDGANEHEPSLLLQAGRCFKGAGNYEEALRHLEQAVRLNREDSEILSELADVNALLGESRTAKALFREAFYLDPRKIDLRAMESELIIRLADSVQKLGYGGEELAEWIPVYGNLYGIFTVKRELKQVELGKLKQSIFSLENEIRNGGEGSLKPRLINRYFWLIDHYENTRDNPGLVEQTMLKIKIIDSDIYERYIR
jgi:tetratricopeptide (TPR) repeat protein